MGLGMFTYGVWGFDFPEGFFVSGPGPALGISRFDQKRPPPIGVVKHPQGERGERGDRSRQARVLSLEEKTKTWAFEGLIPFPSHQAFARALQRGGFWYHKSLIPFPQAKQNSRASVPILFKHGVFQHSGSVSPGFLVS